MSDALSVYGPVDVIAAYNDFFIGNYFEFATLTLIIYEYVITIGDEIELFWKQKRTLASALFLINRYLVLIYNLTLLRGFYPFTLVRYEVCGHWANGTRAVEIMCYLPWAAFSALRVYALSGRSWLLGGLVFLLSSAPIAVNFADFHWSTIGIDPVYGCGQDVEEPYSISILFPPVTALSRSCLIAADLIVIVVTWVATYSTTKMTRAAGQSLAQSFSALLLRDGMIYFVVLLIMNAMHLAFSTSSLLVSAGLPGQISDIILIIEPLNAVLVGRFILNLQEANVRAHHVHTSWGGASSTIRFDHVLGSLGSSLAPSTLAPDPEADYQEERCKADDSVNDNGLGEAGRERQSPEGEVGCGPEGSTLC